MKKNQTKVFVATISGYEYMKILGVDLTLEDSWRRHNGEPNKPDACRQVLECPAGSPFTLDEYDPKHGYKVHENKVKK